MDLPDGKPQKLQALEQRVDLGLTALINLSADNQVSCTGVVLRRHPRPILKRRAGRFHKTCPMASRDSRLLCRHPSGPAFVRPIVAGTLPWARAPVFCHRYIVSKNHKESSVRPARIGGPQLRCLNPPSGQWAEQQGRFW